jgi:hypothetical protein
MNFATRNPSDPTTASVWNDAWEAILGAAAAVLPADAVAEADADAVAHDVAVADDVAALPTEVVAEVAAEVVDSAAAASRESPAFPWTMPELCSAMTRQLVPGTLRTRM